MALFLFGSGIAFCQGTNMRQDRMDLIVSNRGLESRHIPFSVGDYLDKFSVRFALNLRGAQVSGVETFPYGSPRTVCAVASLTLRFKDGRACGIVLRGSHIHQANQANNKKTGGNGQKGSEPQFPGPFHNSSKAPLGSAESRSG